ncbi:MAG: site-specific DNA-methyltransferase [Bdellovibrionales bacterium]|nr:site-specific DNA-methyltransferase [Bdellovibrionales bacterium]
MAKKPSKSKSKSDGLKKNVENYEHKGAKRLNNPPVGLVNTKTEKAETKKTYKYDPHLTPQLQWAGKDERTQFDLPTVSLHVHERIDPKTIIEAVRSSDGLNWEQLNLFNRPINKLNFIKEIQFYQHEKDWSNRMIAGDSLLVMNSLIEKEGMSKKVQMVFLDPPYGIKYGSNFQPFINKRDVKEKDEDLSSEPEMIKAFRDTWELGIHSYLSYLRDRFLLAKELLTDTGSIFVQISDENIHHVREALDEIFGPENFVSIITFRKKSMPLGSKTIESMCDFIVWYSKDIEKVKVRQLYKPLETQNDSHWSWIELENGERRKLNTAEKNGEVALPKGSRKFQLISLYPPSFSAPNVFDVEVDGQKFRPRPGACWITDKEGFQNLIKARRVMKEGEVLRYVLYENDFPFTKITALWTDTQGAQGKVYVVQTHEKIIQRCMLMSTDCGDLVFDPTCGGGTTAVVAENWGRRWITCDTSRVAIALAKQRVMTSVFPFYALEHETEGVASGFKYQQVQRVTLKSIANNDLSKQETLFDQPLVDKTKARVTGPFTVEAVPAPVVRELRDGGDEHQPKYETQDWIGELRRTGIRLNNKKFLKLSRLEPIQATKWVHADGETDETPAQRVVVSFGPAFAPLEQRQVELALQEVEKLKPSPTVVVFAAFQFDPEAAKDIDDIEWGGVSILKVQMNADLFTDDLKKKRSSNESFWLVGQPDIESQKIKSGDEKGKYKVKVNGFDYYNTKTGTIESGGANKIAMWLLDTDYDGRSLLPRQVFFPMADVDEGWSKLAKSLKAEIDQDLIEAYRGTESLPFEAGENKKIAIKIIDDRGIESLTIRELE